MAGREGTQIATNAAAEIGDATCGVIAGGTMCRDGRACRLFQTGLGEIQLRRIVTEFGACAFPEAHLRHRGGDEGCGRVAA